MTRVDSDLKYVVGEDRMRLKVLKVLLDTLNESQDRSLRVTLSDLMSKIHRVPFDKDGGIDIDEVEV